MHACMHACIHAYIHTYMYALINEDASNRKEITKLAYKVSLSIYCINALHTYIWGFSHNQAEIVNTIYK